LFQLIFQPLFIPLCVVLGATNNIPLGTYIADGLSCFVGITPAGVKNSCDYSTIIYAIYIVVNLTYNILLLLLVKRASSLLSFMALKAVLPIAVVLFIIPWPIIGPSTINDSELLGLVVILVGIVLHRIASYIKDEYKQGCCSCFLPFCIPGVHVKEKMYVQ